MDMMAIERVPMRLIMAEEVFVNGVEWCLAISS